MLPATAPYPTIILCVHRSLSPETGIAFAGLITQGYQYIVRYGDALISRARSEAVSRWYFDVPDSDVFLMFDDDISFSLAAADHVVNLARTLKTIVIGACSVANGEGLALVGLDGDSEIHFTNDGQPKEIKWGGTGFMAVSRAVIDALVPTLPLCIGQSKKPDLYPFFRPFIYESGRGKRKTNIYLSEDYAFCERAREEGFKIYVDLSVLITHHSRAPWNVNNMPSRKQK